MKYTLLLSTLALSLGAVSTIAHAGERAYLDNKDIAKVVTKAESLIADTHQTGCVVVVNESGALLFAQHLDNAPWDVWMRPLRKHGHRRSITPLPST